MADQTGDLLWKFLSDHAVERDDQDKFGVHSAYAKVLYSIARNCETPFSIALYSSWGTGKTSICNLVRELAQKDGSVRYVYLDVWKYSDEPLKRWVLLETHRSLTAQGSISDFEFQGRSLQSHLEFEESWEDHDRVSVNLTAIRWLGVGVAGFVGVFLALLFFSPRTSYVGHIVTMLSAYLAAGSAVVFLFEAVVKELFKSLSGLVFDRKVRHVTENPAFSAEKFGEIFRDMVRKATVPQATKESENKRVIFVFDNLDRCSEEVAVAAIGVIKTYLDEPRCVYIIPCDEAALMRHIEKSYTPHKDGDGRAYAKEFLNKFFQATLRLPVAAEFDIERFLDEQISSVGMNDLPADARDVLVLGYLGQTPRQIKRVLNDLTAYRFLAVEAEKQGLVEGGALTSHLSLLTKMSVISVEWPSFLNSLADDPELWSELTAKLSDGQPIADNRIEAGLVSFLNATRHVSSKADIRPFIYLKRVQYEKNQTIAAAAQNHLRKGESKEFLELLRGAKSPTDQESIIRIATELTRHWLDAQPPRDLVLKNSASVLLKAAVMVPTSRPLEIAVSELLSYLLNVTQGAELPDILSLPDLFAFSPSINSAQKERCIERIANLFLDPGTPLGKNYIQYWGQLLDHQEQLPPELRSRLSTSIGARYASNESDALQMLFEAAQKRNAENGSAIDWAVSSTVLGQVAGELTLLSDDTDRQRTAVLTKFQSQMSEEAKTTAAARIGASLQGTRTRAFDQQARTAIQLLSQLGPAHFSGASVEGIAAALIEQVTAQGNYQLKAPWLSTLITIRGALSPSSQASVDNLYRPILQDAPDPAALVQLLTEMTPPFCSLLLAIPENIPAIRTQAQRLEARLGKANAATERARILGCFPASGLIAEMGIVDAERSWDLALFAGTVSRGKSEGVAANVLRKQIEVFVDQFLTGKASVHSEALDLLLGVTREAPELLDEAVARSLAGRCIEVLASSVDKHYSELRFLGTKLSQENRLWLVGELVSRFLEPRHAQWIKVLQKLSEDVAADENLSADKALVNDLTDYAFEAARVSPSEASAILVSLFPHLESDRAEANVDRAEDNLITLENTGAPVSQMEPYLAMLKNANVAMAGALPTKLMAFCDRMLGTAKSEDERNSILAFLRDADLSLVSSSLAERILELVPRDDVLAESARKTIAQSGSPEANGESEKPGVAAEDQPRVEETSSEARIQ